MKGKENVHKFGQKDPRHVPDHHRDFHAQVRTLLQELLLIQELKDGIRWQFVIDGVKQDKVYHLYFPILFLIGDTMEHTNCEVYVVVPKLLLFTAFAIVLVPFLM